MFILPFVHIVLFTCRDGLFELFKNLHETSIIVAMLCMKSIAIYRNYGNIELPALWYLPYQAGEKKFRSIFMQDWNFIWFKIFLWHRSLRIQIHLVNRYNTIHFILPFYFKFDSGFKIRLKKKLYGVSM